MREERRLIPGFIRTLLLREMDILCVVGRYFYLVYSRGFLVKKNSSRDEKGKD
jgi:hypothetical protein